MGIFMRHEVLVFCLPPSGQYVMKNTFYIMNHMKVSLGQSFSLTYSYNFYRFHSNKKYCMECSGNIVSILVLTSQDIDLKPSFANILICLVSKINCLSGTWTLFVW